MIIISYIINYYLLRISLITFHISPCCLVFCIFRLFFFCILFCSFVLLLPSVVVILTFVRHTKKRGKRRGRYVPSYRFCTTQILTWGPIADRRLRRLGRSVRSDRPSRSGPSTSVSVYNPSFNVARVELTANCRLQGDSRAKE